MSDQQQAEPGNEAVEALRSKSRTVQGKAIASLYERVSAKAGVMAGRMLGSKAQRVDLQPESVVMSVLAKELPRLAVVCNDDQHLEARLMRAIRNRFIDRLRAKKAINPDSRTGEGEDSGFDTADDADGPRSVIEAFESSRAEQEALEKMVSRLTGACKSDDERTMVEQFLVRNQGWSSVASQLGKNETAAKVAFSRLRLRLLEQVLEPLRFALSGPEWTVAEALCVQRRSLTEVGASTGTSPEHVRMIFETRILPALRSEYGAAGIESLIRLIGKVKADDADGKRPTR